MPGETTSEMTEQQVSTVDVDENLLKQSKPDLPDNKLPDDVSNESISIPSINELPNGLKRPLPDGVDSDKKKKKRLTDTSDDEFEDTSNDDSGKNHIELLIQKVSESLENTIDDTKSNVSNKTHNLNNETNLSLNTINHNGKNSIDDQDCKDDYPDKNTSSKDISKETENKTSNIKEVNNSCKIIENSVETVKNGINKLNENNILTNKSTLYLNKSSSLNNLDIENSDLQNENVVNDIPVTENISLAINDSTVIESNLNHSSTNKSKTENIENIVNSKKNTDETKIIENRPCSSNTSNVCSNGIDQDLEVIDSDTNSDVSLSDLTDLPEDINDIINGVHQMTKESFPQLLKLFSKKELTYDQFDSLCTQKIIEIMTEKSYMGKERSELQLLKEREKHWRLKYCSLNRQFKEIKTIVNVHKLDLKNNEHAKPHLITRTVGLQAVLCPKKEGSMKLPKLAIPLPKPDNNPVSIVDDDVELEAVKSANPSTSNTTNTPTKKQTPPILTPSKSPVVSPKTVTAAKSLNPIKAGTTTIDLTGNDDVIGKSNVINLKRTISPVKIIRRRSPAILNCNSSKILTQVPNSLSSSSNSMIRKASGSPRQTIISNKDTINTSPKSKNLKPFLIDVSRVEPVIVQPCTVAYTTQRVPSQIAGTLQPISTIPRQITVSQLSASLKTLTPVYTTCRLPVARVSRSLPGIALPQATPGTAITACRLPISIRAIPHPASSDRNSTGSQSNRPPPPPAIPLKAHPSPVPGIPNQKSLPSWKKLPPAPKLSISKTIEANNMPQALVLSWTMNINKTIAEIVSYQVYAYQETPDQPPNIDLWKKIGNVNALPLPMACSLTHFTNGEKYHFLVRAVDVYTRVGPFSAPQSIS